MFRKLISFIICLAIPLLVGFAAGIATSAEVDGWFSTLQKPAFNPPNTVFSPVWTSLYILMGISLYIIWNSPRGNNRKSALNLFGLQLGCNFFWSIFFFSFHALFLAIIDIILLWILIRLMIRAFYSIKPVAAWLNIPYLLWVSFATVLNISIWYINKA